MKSHDLNTDHVSFIYDLDEELNVEINNLVRKLLRKRTLFIAKAIPLIPKACIPESSQFLLRLSLVEYLCTQGSLTLVAGESYEQVYFGPCCMTVVHIEDDK